jgi:hypothetical protein
MQAFGVARYPAHRRQAHACQWRVPFNAFAFSTTQYCCTGSYGSPQTCRTTSFSRLFKNACPRAYSYAYDDPSTWLHALGLTISSPSAVIDNNAANLSINSMRAHLSMNFYMNLYKSTL